MPDRRPPKFSIEKNGEFQTIQYLDNRNMVFRRYYNSPGFSEAHESRYDVETNEKLAGHREDFRSSETLRRDFYDRYAEALKTYPDLAVTVNDSSDERSIQGLEALRNHLGLPQRSASLDLGNLQALAGIGVSDLGGPENYGASLNAAMDQRGHASGAQRGGGGTQLG